MKKNLILIALSLGLTACATSTKMTPPVMKMTTPTPASILTPNTMDTRLGKMQFFDGMPDKATVQKVYDNLDFQRAVQVYMTTATAASMDAMRRGLGSLGASNDTVVVMETLTDSKALMLTANTDTLYALSWLDLTNGPLVIEAPANVLGGVDDAWQRWVGDIGNTGADRGKGGKYVLLPPNYKGEVPAGYFVLRSPTFANWFGLRGFLVNNDPKPTADHLKKGIKIYPLASADNPPPTKFVNASGKSFNSIHASDVTYFDEINAVVQSEPQAAVDPETRGLLASIGIQQGKVFAPDARMKKILREAAAVGNATVRALLFDNRNPDAYYYKDSNWKRMFIGGNYEFSPGKVLDVDARTMFANCCTGVTPAMALKLVGLGSQYAHAERDSGGQYLDGSKNYKLTLPKGIPAKNFWSLIAYDPQTRSYLQTDQQFPRMSSQVPGMQINADTSVDVYFGPQAPAGKESNWVQTVPGKGWFVMLRLYGPLQPWFDGSWRPGEVQLLN